MSVFFAFVSYSAVLPTRAETNLIGNGDFSKGLENWEMVTWIRVGEAPHVDISEYRGNPSLYIDTPTGSSAFVFQAFSFPHTSFAELRFRVCGGMDSVRVRVYLENITDPIDQWEPLDEFDPAGKRSLGGVFTTKWYNVTKYAGTEALLAFWADTPNNEGTGACVHIDDVSVNIVTATSSIITCHVDPISLTIGQNVTVTGFILPSLDGNVTLTYSRPNGSITIRNVTAYEGDYQDIFTADTTGIWTVFASWNGSYYYKGATSLPVSFITSQFWQLNVTDSTITINDVLVNLHDGIEALPGEELTGSISVTSSVVRRPELDPLVVFNTWEKDRWDLLVFYLGTVRDVYGEGMDPFGVKQILAIPFRVFERSLDNEKGAFVVDYDYQFPMRPDVENDLYGLTLVQVSDHPSFKAPAKNGTYYIVFCLSAQRSARECIYPPSKEFGAFSNLTINSVWDVDSQLWENVTLKNRGVDHHNLFAVPIHVIKGVDEAISSAQSVVFKLKDNHLPTHHSEGNLSLAISEYNKRHFSLAKEYAQDAFDAGSKALDNYRNDTGEYLQEVKDQLDELRNFEYISQTVAEVSGLERTLEQAELEYDSGNYLKTAQLGGQIEDEITRTTRSARMIGDITLFIFAGTLFYAAAEGYASARTKERKLPNVFAYLFRYVLLAASIGALWQLLNISGIFRVEFLREMLSILILGVLLAIPVYLGVKHIFEKKKTQQTTSDSQ